MFFHLRSEMKLMCQILIKEDVTTFEEALATLCDVRGLCFKQVLTQLGMLFAVLQLCPVR